jgi:hypothetical protein
VTLSLIACDLLVPYIHYCCQRCFQKDSEQMRQLTLRIEIPGNAAVVQGQPLLVELRDTSLQDAPAVVLGQTRFDVPHDWRNGVQVTLAVDDVPDGTTVWAHLDADRDGRVSLGDFITMQSYPISAGVSEVLTIRLKEV